LVPFFSSVKNCSDSASSILRTTHPTTHPPALSILGKKHSAALLYFIRDQKERKKERKKHHPPSTMTSVQQVTNGIKKLVNGFGSKAETYSHPLDPLSADEISQATAIARKAHKDGRLQFRYTTLVEPPKKDLLVYLQNEISGEQNAPLDRVVEYDYNSDNCLMMID